MQKKTFLMISFLFFTILYGQTYERKWGTMIPIYNKIEKTFSPVKKIFSIPFVAEVNPKTGNLYIVNENLNEIVEYKPQNPKSKLIYTIPCFSGTSVINQIKFDSNNNLIISGRTTNGDLSTSGSFSEEMIPTISSGYSFIAKINTKGKVMWLTYFHEIPLATMALTIDKADNIYVLNKRFRGDILDSSPFQKNGDIQSVHDFQDAISKLNTKGEHIWSTFYVKDDSKINAIMASDKGLYIYGIHLANTSSSNYFGTPGSFLESPSKKTGSTSLIFLSKFDFDGKRIWSSYFGNDKSLIPTPINSIVRNPSYLTVIGEDAYFISLHNTSNSDKNYKLANNEVFLSKAPFSTENHSLTKFSGNGNLEWTTYLPEYGVLFKSIQNDELIISTTVNSNDKNIVSLTSQNAYQTTLNGMQDIFTYTLSLDGKKVNYGTFYGYEGNDTGFTIPTIDGYYTIGYSSYYTQEKSLFAAKKAPLNKFTLYDTGVYVGNFLGYFSK